MSDSRVLAIALDAADPEWLLRLVDRGALPALGALRDRGRVRRVRSSAWLGSGAVWPTWFTGSPPDVHGFYSDWAWRPGTMAVARADHDRLAPFWRDGAIPLTVVDVPFAPLTRSPGVVEIENWGAHDWLGEHPRVHPPAAAGALGELLERAHPFRRPGTDVEDPFDADGLRRLIDACLTGVERRLRLVERLDERFASPLTIVVFTELHRAGHHLWHTADERHPLFERARALPADVREGLERIARTIDRAVACLQSRDPEAAVVVFSLHGMRPTRGIPSMLDDILERLGYASRPRAWQRSPRQWLQHTLGLLKRSAPGAVKRLYHRRVSRSTAMRLAQPPMGARAWDWRRTRAMSLPTDQHGWIRLNLAGRERDGLVPRDRYAALCAEIADTLERLRLDTGDPLVARVINVADRVGSRPSIDLPDLVVHWSEAVTGGTATRVTDLDVPIVLLGPKFSGQHAPDGFLLEPAPHEGAETSIASAEIADLLCRRAGMSGPGAHGRG